MCWVRPITSPSRSIAWTCCGVCGSSWVGRPEPLADLELAGVRTHNLKDVSVSFPRGKWTAICGVSGSGKSSLAFHTLHAESERRWLSTLPAWRRLLAESLPRPPLRMCSGLVPTVALRKEKKKKKRNYKAHGD